MRRLITICLVLIGLWSAYWWASAYGMRQSIGAWFSAQEAQGWQADFADIGTDGFPLRHITKLTNPALADPVNGTAWRSAALTFESPAIWPGHMSVRFADAPQRMSYFDETVILTPQDMVADLRLHPGLALELEEMALTAGPWTLTTADGAKLIAADSLVLAMRQTDDPATYLIDANSQTFTPGPRLREIAAISETLPPSFDALTLDMTVTFTRPWDRAALEQSRPQPRRVDLKEMDAHWGALRVRAAGSFDVDAEGIPDGVIAIKAENWRDMLDMAQRSGALPADLMTPTERVFSMLAGLSGNPQTLDVQLNLRNGFVALGPIPLGPAPRFILR
ncbi:DUF2125 domain-containing protein [Thalassococcus sp. S3]|uniref:DUF2125 domain-containing protein n=1 Tax=Thalassococcus sp. S3 TaxID=2017482 RepID=UPI001024332D|nr:DUF2125 domain-containing protein [Thalassococcus sp. S3]QBF30877.1 hypothetical protein CFI11_06560 [Thalassococcus sp. S3]